MSAIRFILNGQVVEPSDCSPNTTLLQFLRSSGRCGTKEGCAEGDCGACSVAMLDPLAPQGATWRAVNSCLIFLPMLHGREVVTVEGLTDLDSLHPAQKELATRMGSQCGYCTPGIVMSLFEACYREDLSESWQVDDQLCGNLCRCTGYQPIREAGRALASTQPDDRFRETLLNSSPPDIRITYQHESQVYLCPGTLQELWDAIDGAPRARLIAGGTDLALLVTKRFEELPELLSLEGVPELRGVRVGTDKWSVGATTLLSDLEAQAAKGLPLIARMLRFFASRQIKNRATLGGNLCNASPIGDMAPVLMAMGAEVILSSRQGDRRVHLDEFFLGYRQTALQAGEILSSVEVPVLGPEWKVGAYKVSKRRELDISAVCAAFALRLDGGGCVAEVRLCYGGMAATTKRAQLTEEALLGQQWTQETVERVLPELSNDFSPIDDQRGSGWFRATLARNLLIGFFLETEGASFQSLPSRPSSTLVLAER